MLPIDETHPFYNGGYARLHVDKGIFKLVRCGPLYKAIDTDRTIWVVEPAEWLASLGE